MVATSVLDNVRDDNDGERSGDASSPLMAES